MSFIKNLLFNFFIFVITINSNIYSENIIFDLGGVLLRTDKLVTAKKAGLLSLPIYSLTHFKNPRTALFEMLNSIEPFTVTTIKPCDETGRELPGIMCDWLKGIPSEDILKRIEYSNNKQLKPLLRLAKAVFDPETMANSHSIIPACKELIDQCVKQGHKVYILSNWDAQSFGKIQQRYSAFFDQFSGIVLSGECGLLKPDPAIYMYLINEYKLDPSACFFIDNQQENITGAQISGIKGCLLTSSWSGKLNFEKIQEELTTWLNQRKNLVHKKKGAISSFRLRHR